MQAYERLEHRWAEFNELDPKGMVACSSGTAALHLAVQCLKEDRSVRVVVPDYTMVACARAVSLAGMKPVFLDCLPFELTLDPTAVYDYLADGNDWYETVMSVHTYGRRCDLTKLHALTSVYDVYHIEDLAEAHGLRPHLETDAACWSFYKNKIVAGEEGGAVWFRDPARANHARSLRSLGFTDAHDYTHVPGGHNYRMSNAHAELVLHSLTRYVTNMGRRWEVYGLWDAAVPQHLQGPRPDCPWVFDVQVPGLNRPQQTQLVRELQGLGLSARFGFVPMTAQQEYRGDPAANPVSYKAWTEVVYVGLDPTDLPGPLTLQLARDLILKYDRR